MKKVALFTCVFLWGTFIFSQTVPSPGNVGLQPSAFSRHLLTLPNQSQWQTELGVNPNGNVLVAGTNVTLVSGSGFTQINASGGGTNTNTLALFTSTNANVNESGGLIIQQAHGFTNVPTILRVVLVCQHAELNMIPGQELDCASGAYLFGTASYLPAFSVFADSTNVYVNEGVASGGLGGAVVINNKLQTGVGNPITPTDWTVKVYARP